MCLSQASDVSTAAFGAEMPKCRNGAGCVMTLVILVILIILITLIILLSLRPFSD